VLAINRAAKRPSSTNPVLSVSAGIFFELVPNSNNSIFALSESVQEEDVDGL
jgi:hypothetical protein